MTPEDAITLVDSPGAPGGRSTPLAPYLFVVLECDRLRAGGARYALSGVDELVIGRGEDRGLTRHASGGMVHATLRIPGRWMSSTHARLLRTPEGWVLEDAGSTNGVSLRGRRVERVLLADGDVFELGHTFLLFREAMPAEDEGPRDFDSSRDAGPYSNLTTLLPTLQQDFWNLARVARSSLPITVLGETGTGKELAARAVHRLSGRQGAFVAVNCGALAPNLVESQLFGHVKGAFSGATRDEPGFFRAAERGTLLLDEIGDLPLAAQPALLRALQESEITPVGASRAVPLDVRVVAATHRPLDSWALEQRFRSDLLARLSGYRVHLPPLRERREDIGLVLANALDEFTRGQPGVSVADYQLAPEAGLALLSDAWPWNLRELVQHLKRALVLAPTPLLTKDLLGLEEAARSENRSSEKRALRRHSDADLCLKRDLLSALEEHQG
ncbi:MAG TPA: sigma 54-interacting transcriptional regulator, partial [Polyangiaceae bacterium]